MKKAILICLNCKYIFRNDIHPDYKNASGVPCKKCDTDATIDIINGF